MVTLSKIRSLRRIGLAVIAAAGFGAAVVGLPAPAQAQWWYHPYPYWHYHPRPYWYPGYAPGWRGCGPGWHWERGHWNAWGRWVPPGCRRNWWW